jgi:hypothetical protein
VAVGPASKFLDMSEVIGDAIENRVWHTAGAAGCGGRGKPVTEVDTRADGEDPVFGGAAGVLKHGRGGVRESGPLSLHLSELAVGVRGSKLGVVGQG